MPISHPLGDRAIQVWAAGTTNGPTTTSRSSTFSIQWSSTRSAIIFELNTSSWCCEPIELSVEDYEPSTSHADRATLQAFEPSKIEPLAPQDRAVDSSWSELIQPSKFAVRSSHVWKTSSQRAIHKPCWSSHPLGLRAIQDRAAGTRESAVCSQQNQLRAFNKISCVLSASFICVGHHLQSHRAIRIRASSLWHGDSGPVELSAFEPSDPVEKHLRTFSKISWALSAKSDHRSASYHSHRAITTQASIQQASGFEPFYRL